MDIPIRKFGQYVFVEVTDKKGTVIFSTDTLRVDFDIRNVVGYIRAKITIFNLAPKTIKNIGSGENYVTIKVALHDSPVLVVADKLSISNTLEEKKVPNGEFNLFCVSSIYTKHLTKQVDAKVQDPTLPKIIAACIEHTEFKGNVKFVHFPTEVKEYKPPKLESTHQGSLASVLDTLAEQYHFNYYTVDNTLVLMYKPNRKNVHKTDLHKDKPIVLSSDNMRNNPKLGVATLSLVLNLDPKIHPSTVLDLSNLITVGVSGNQDTFDVAKNIIKDSIAGYQFYQVLQVQHKGSNWTEGWLTQVIASNPSKGRVMNSDKWWL